MTANKEEELNYPLELAKGQYKLGFQEGSKQTIKDVLKIVDNKEFLERLSDMEHEQWIVWTSYMLNNFTEKNKEKWFVQCETPYPELSNKEQESDRHFARLVIEELKAQIEKVQEAQANSTSSEELGVGE